MSNRCSFVPGPTWFTVRPHPIETVLKLRKHVTYPQPLSKEEVEARFEPKQV